MGASIAWYEIMLNATISAATALYAASCISHIAASWVLRKDFNLAVRSPLLAIMSGSIAAWVSCFAVLRIAVFPGQLASSIEGGVAEVIHVPMVLWGFTFPYAVRGVRLIVMYNPHMRGSWGRFLNEPPMIKKLVALFFATEAIAWSASLVYRVDSITGLAFIAIGINVLFTLGICIMLVGTLRRIDDMCNMSLELQRVGAFALISLVMGFSTTALPTWFQGYWVMLFVVARFHVALFYTNIQPTRTILRQQGDYHQREGIYALFPYVPCGSKIKIAIEEAIRSPRSAVKNQHFDDTLGRIMSFQPLLEAFEEFCRRNLCSESLQFLIAVNEFKKSLRTPGETDDTTKHFAKLCEIIDKFVRDRSPFEVNIGSNTKFAVLKMANAANFRELSLEDREQILDGAKREVGKVLNENLYERFRATEQYVQINDMMFSTPIENS